MTHSVVALTILERITSVNRAYLGMAHVQPQFQRPVVTSVSAWGQWQ